MSENLKQKVAKSSQRDNTKSQRDTIVIEKYEQPSREDDMDKFSAVAESMGWIAPLPVVENTNALNSLNGVNTGETFYVMDVDETVSSLRSLMKENKLNTEEHSSNGEYMTIDQDKNGSYVFTTEKRDNNINNTEYVLGGKEDLSVQINTIKEFCFPTENYISVLPTCTAYEQDITFEILYHIKSRCVSQISVDVLADFDTLEIVHAQLRDTKFTQTDRAVTKFGAIVSKDDDSNNIPALSHYIHSHVEGKNMKRVQSTKNSSSRYHFTFSHYNHDGDDDEMTLPDMYMMGYGYSGSEIAITFRVKKGKGNDMSFDQLANLFSGFHNQTPTIYVNYKTFTIWQFDCIPISLTSYSSSPLKHGIVWKRRGGSEYISKHTGNTRQELTEDLFKKNKNKLVPITLEQCFDKILEFYKNKNKNK